MVRRTFWIFVVVVWFAVAGVGVYWLQEHQISDLQYARPYRDTLALPQIVDRDRADSDPAEEELPQLAELLSVGYEEMATSVLWLRVIQAFGAKLQHVRDNPLELRAIENFFWVITEFDPHFVEAYRFGNFVLGDEGGDQVAALRLLDRGIVRNYKQTYILPYEAIFICLNNLKNYKLARYYVRLALRSRNCPDYVKRTENYIALKRGNYEIALERWVRDELEAAMNHQKYVLEIARMQINNIVNQWHFSIIEAAMDRYFGRHEDYPARLEQLEEENLIGSVRQVDGPRLVQLLDAAENAGIPINEAVDVIMGAKNRRGCIIESNRVPRDLRGEPYLLLDDTVIPLQKRPEVVERQTLRKNVEGHLLAIRRRIEGYAKTTGRYPTVLEELPEMQPGAREQLARQDVAGMRWNYDPKTGTIRSYIFPEL